jgi:hypothetical protein
MLLNEAVPALFADDSKLYRNITSLQQHIGVRITT